MSRIFFQSFKSIGVKFQGRETVEIASHLDPYGSPFVLNAFFSKLKSVDAIFQNKAPILLKFCTLLLDKVDS